MRRPLAVAALSLLAACTVGPDYREPRTTVPAAFEASSAAGAPAQFGPVLAWWSTFEDPVLDSLVARAVRANPALRLAEARVQEARALRGVVSADAYPAVDAQGSASRSRTSDNLGRAPGTTSNLFQAGFDAVWEADVFGRVRRSVEAADADVAATVEERRDVLVTLLGEVARNYVELRGAQRQAAIARSNLAAQTETLELTRSRLAAGLATELDVVRSEAQVAATASTVPAFEGEARRAIHRIGVLLGEPPGALVAELSREAAIPRAPDAISVGLPSELLRRRPDVRRAERRLAAATARIGVATAELFPSFSLSAAFGLASDGTGDFLDSGSRFASVGPAFRWPALDFGRVRGAIDARSAVEAQAAADYEQTVLTSLREVEDALVSLREDRARRALLVTAADANRRAVDLALQLYREGQTDFLSVLDAQRDLFLSEAALVASERALSADVVALYKALGGGWEIESALADAPARGEAGRRVIDLSGEGTGER